MPQPSHAKSGGKPGMRSRGGRFSRTASTTTATATPSPTSTTVAVAAPIATAPRRVRRPLPSYVLPVGLWQIVVWQLAILAVLATWRPFDARTIAALSIGGVAVLATSVRVQGRCGCDWLAAAVAFRRGGEVAAPDASADPLETVLPALEIRNHTDRAGNSVGIAGVGDGWSAVVRIDAPADVTTGPLIGVLGEFFRDGEVRLASAQLVVRTVPVPDDDPRRTIWLAVRYRPAEGPRAARARGGGELGALRATASAAFGLARALEQAGCGCSVLDATSLREQLLAALAVRPIAQEAIRETWRDWSIGSIRQDCSRPAYGTDPMAALDRFDADAVFTCVSYTLRRGPRETVGAELIVRAGFADDAPRQGRAAFAESLGIALDHLDGRHGAYLRATLPLALARVRAPVPRGRRRSPRPRRAATR